MAVYFITGKLGSGKTLCSVGRILDYLKNGNKIATNLDLDLSNLCGKDSKTPEVYRVPDKPTVEDLELLGKGNLTYDESKNGLLVLDECGTWFNSRQWNDKKRQALINWLLHARKLGWDVIFIVQNIQIVDKQARLALCEHLVMCKRADRFLSIPIIEPLFRLLTGAKIPKPHFHVASIKYGDQEMAPIIDRWWFKGANLFTSYDTKQAFTDSYSDGVYQLLPPWYTHGRYQTPRDMRFYMRLTKIYFKKWNRVLLASIAAIFGFLIAMTSSVTANQEPLESIPEPQVIENEVNQGNVDSQSPIDGNSQQSQASDEPFIHPMKGFKITGQASANGQLLFMTVGNGSEQYSLQELKSLGYQVRVIDECRLRVLSEGVPYVVHAQSCAASQIASEATLRAYIANAPKFADPNRDYSRSE